MNHLYILFYRKSLSNVRKPIELTQNIRVITRKNIFSMRSIGFRTNAANDDKHNSILFEMDMTRYNYL